MKGPNHFLAPGTVPLLVSIPHAGTEVPDELAQRMTPAALQRADVDCRLAEMFSRPGAYARPRDFQPLPLLGIPGVVAENSDPSYYGDLRQFRPARSASR